jgi:hypothetical protein
MRYLILVQPLIAAFQPSAGRILPILLHRGFCQMRLHRIAVAKSTATAAVMSATRLRPRSTKAPAAVSPVLDVLPAGRRTAVDHIVAGMLATHR